MAIKLPTKERLFIPDVVLTLDDDTTVKNRELTGGDQIKCELKAATIRDKSNYVQGYSTKAGKSSREYTDLNYLTCVKKHVTSITGGLEEFGITDGRTLVNHEPNALLDEVIKECFFKVCGFHKDDEDTKEHTEGE